MFSEAIASSVYVETHLSENFQLVLTHVTDLQVGIPSIPLDTTNGLWKIMMALINNTFPLNTYFDFVVALFMSIVYMYFQGPRLK